MISPLAGLGWFGAAARSPPRRLHAGLYDFAVSNDVDLSGSCGKTAGRSTRKEPDDVRQVINRNEDGFTVQITVPYNRSMLDFKETLQQQLNAAGVLATHEGLRQFDTDGSPITVGSMKLTSKGQLPKD